SPITGQATANAALEIEVGFDPFSWSERVPLASVVLADFELFKCPPPSDEPLSPPAKGLATPISSDLVLNTGDRAVERVFFDNEAGGGQVGGQDVGEFYVIRNAVDQQGAPIAGKLDITGFGITQRYDVPANIIRGNLGAFNDSLVIGP